MIVVESLGILRKVCGQLEGPLGLVPTMGYLHAGHLSLVKQAREQNVSVGVSIFVNPTQFGPQEDLEAYPRALDRDLRLLRAEGVDLVWTPKVQDVYPPGYQTWVTVDQISQPLEGARRPGHFRGVATVVAKLLLAFQPQRAYFGQKDFQQVRVIQRMVRDLGFPLEIVLCPTVRESDGLAMSSRNSYLNPGERSAASILYRALIAAKQAWEAGERDADLLRSVMLDVLNEEPLAHTEYVSVADPHSLEELQGRISQAVCSMAVRMGKTRLIDNLLLGLDLNDLGR